MATAIQDLGDWYWGEDRTFEFEVEDDAGVPQNITGMTFKLELRVTEDDPTAKLTKSTANGGIVITNGPLGLLEVRINKSDTDPGAAPPVTPGSYKYGLARIDTGQWNVLAIGNATLSKAAVRP